MGVRTVARATGYAFHFAAVLAGADAAIAAIPAQAAEEKGITGAYARVDAGPSISTDAGGDIFNGTGFGNSFGVSPVIDIGVGAAVPLSGLNLRGELEVGYRPSFTGDHSAPNATGTTTLSTRSRVRSWTTMANVYADFNTDTGFVPYLGVGLGIGFNHLGTLTYSFNGTPSATEPGSDKTSFAWSGMAGVGYKLSDASTLDLRYRYLDAGKIASSGAVTLFNGATVAQPPVVSHVKTNEVTIGVRCQF